MKMKEFPVSNLLEKCFLEASHDFKLTSNGVQFPCHKLVIAGQSETLMVSLRARQGPPRLRA